VVSLPQLACLPAPAAALPLLQAQLTLPAFLPACPFPMLCPALQERVRKDISEWLRYLRNSIGFDGWRFDYVKVNEVKAAATCLSCMSAGLPCVPARVLLGLPYNRKCFAFTCCRRCCVLTCTAGV
jgi:hypothetical protein